MSSLETSKGNHLDLLPCNHILEDQWLVVGGLHVKSRNL